MDSVCGSLRVETIEVKISTSSLLYWSYRSWNIDPKSYCIIEISSNRLIRSKVIGRMCGYCCMNYPVFIV